MRIGTWNLAGRWSDRHLDCLSAADCDFWLLTEVSDWLVLPHYTGHVTSAEMRSKVRWAGIFSRVALEPLADPHPASAMARIGETTFVSSILPWKGTGDVQPRARTRHALETLLAALPNGGLCWGGDWNHALSGPRYAGSKAGRETIAHAANRLGLAVATADLPHALSGLLSIDHIAVPNSWPVLAAQRIAAVDGPDRLSDHDIYVVDVSQ